MPELTRYQKDNPYYQAYRDLNKDKRNAYSREYRKLNRKQLTAYNAQWVAKHPGYMATSSMKLYRKYRATGTFPLITRFNSGIKAAKKRGLPWDINFEDWKNLIINTCHYCHESLKYQIGHSLDRKDNSKGYSLDNVVPCCGKCNRVKSDVLTSVEMEIAMKAVIAYRGTLQF